MEPLCQLSRSCAAAAVVVVAACLGQVLRPGIRALYDSLEVAEASIGWPWLPLRSLEVSRASAACNHPLTWGADCTWRIEVVASDQRTLAVVGNVVDAVAVVDAAAVDGGDGGAVGGAFAAAAAVDRPLWERRKERPSLPRSRCQIHHRQNWAYAVETIYFK